MNTWLDSIAEFIVQQTWQLTIVFGLVLAACWLLRSASAHWRYLLWLIVVVKCLMPPLVKLSLPVLPSKPTAVLVGSSMNATLPQTVAVTGGSKGKGESSEIATDSPRPATIALGNTDKQNQAAVVADAQIAPVRPSLSWQQCLVIAWVFIAGTIIAQIVVRMMWTANHWRGKARWADEPIQNEVRQLATKLGLRFSPAVYMDDAVDQPFVWGYLRGAIYLPSNFSEIESADQRQSVLAHELAHLLRWDVAMNHLQNLVQALFFFHPLIWLANYKLRQEREKCCDEFVLSTSGLAPTIYCEAIVSMLARKVSSRQSSMALAVTGSLHNVKERIATMLTPSRTFHQGPSRTAVVSTLLIAALVLPTAVLITRPSANVIAQDKPPSSEQPLRNLSLGNFVTNGIQQILQTPNQSSTKSQTSVWTAGQTMDFRAVHAETKEPLSDVTLELQNMGPGIDFSDVKIQKTDADGWSRIPLPDKPPTAVRVYPLKEGFVPLRVYWEGTPHPMLPKTITIEMEPGKKFGGIVQNEAGQPIADVEVTLDFWGDGKGQSPHIRANINRSTRTNKDGRWQLDCMPAEIDNDRSLRIYVNHPDYVSDYLRRGIAPRPCIERPSVKSLYDESAVMVMRKGQTIDGTVVDTQGKAIPNVAIYNSAYYWFEPSKPRAVSDGLGKFQIRGIEYTPYDIDYRIATSQERRGTILTVQAKGYAPELVFVDPTSSPLEIELSQGKSVQGVVVDEKGQPVEGVHIGVANWRGQNSRLNLETKTDASGKFNLADLPTDEVNFRVGKEGYMNNNLVAPTPDQVKLILRATVKIIGSVVDAETGQSLEKFSLIPGIDYEDGRNPSWLRWMTTPIVNKGQFEMPLVQPEISWRLRIEADGYMPAESRIFRLNGDDRGEVRHDFKLTKSAPLTGTIIGTDEMPLAGADVYLATELMNIDKRKVISPPDLQVKSDANGRFEFPPEVEPFCVVVVHETGIGMITEAECRTPPKIKLEAWSAKNDRLQITRKPAKGQMSDFPVKWP